MTNPELAFGTLDEMIAEQAAALGDKTFLIDADSGNRISYKDIDTAASEVKGKLIEIGINPGDKVSVAMDNNLAAVEALCGILKAGAVAVPINPEYTSREMAYILSNSDSQVAITQPEIEATVREAADTSDVADILSTASTDANYFRSESAIEKTSSSTPTDTAILMFTSGTTGDPKGVALSHFNILTRFTGGSLAANDEYTFYTVLPLYNIDGFTTTFATMYRGQTNILKNGFSASEFWQDVEKYQANLTSVVPSVLAILLKNGYPDQTEISSFEMFFVSGSYVHEELIRNFEKEFDIEVMEIYGLTEASGTSFGTIEERVISSCGYANRNSELSIVHEESGEQLPPNELGEILIRGPTVFKEYYNNRQATEEVLQGGWFHTGDIGYVDEDGRYFIMDRKKNVIIRGGQNIYPGEIEEIIHSHEDVEDVGVIGKEDEIYGEIIKAIVLPATDISENKLEEALESLCNENLTDAKIPDEFEFVSELPRGETGKILKEELD